MKPIYWVFTALAVVLLLSKKALASTVDIVTTVTDGDPVIGRLAFAIATAEGFFVKGSRPARNNNPGDLTVDIGGGGKAVGKDGIYQVYATVNDGWEDLRGQVRLMLTNKSAIYNRDMSIMEMATHYTTTDQGPWAATVARVMGAKTTTKLSELA